MENRLKNLLCFTYLVKQDYHALEIGLDDYVYEIMDRYIGFRPKDDPMKFINASINVNRSDALVNLFEKHYGKFIDIRTNGPLNTHPNLLKHVEEMVERIPLKQKRAIKLKLLI